MSGIIVIDKPSGINSRAIAGKIARHLGYKKFGHAGTLDPAATGVIVVLLGEGTKLSSYLTGGTKRYEAVVDLGTATDTYDLDGEITETANVPDLDSIDWDAVVATFSGEIQQVPPAVSAVKINGQPSYKRVRRGEVVEIPARTVTIHQLNLTVNAADNQLILDVKCGAGTYLRSLAVDIAKHIGTVGVLRSIRRTQSEPFDLSNACDTEALLAADPERARDFVIDIAQALPHWQRFNASPQLAKRISVGNLPQIADFDNSDSLDWAANDNLLLISDDHVALMKANADAIQSRNHPKPLEYLRVLAR